MEPIRVGVFNADGSNTKPTANINKHDKLANELERVIREKMLNSNEHNCFLTVTEICKKASSKLYSQLPEHIDFHSERFSSRDSLAWFWDEESWIPCEFDANGLYRLHFSHVGKYAAVKLLNESTRKNLLYVSVHLPHKKRAQKESSYTALKKLIEDSREMEIDGVIIAGDFNMAPSALSYTFSGLGLKMSINDDTQATTEGKNSIDNVLTTDSLQHENIEVYEAYDKLTHYPLFAQLKLDD